MTIKKNGFRTERDHLGEVQISNGAYWGAKTQRAVETFQFSGLIPSKYFIVALTFIKKALSQTNVQSGQLDAKLGQAIQQAADELLANMWQEHFVIDPYAPASFQIANVDEVLANRANEILGSESGAYSPVHPNTHVNLAQSDTDVYPTAMRLAILLSLKNFSPIVLDLERMLRRKALEFDKVIKVARTYLQDAVPISLGQEFNTYGASVQRSWRRIDKASQRLLEINLGANNLSNWKSFDSGLAKNAVETLSRLTSIAFVVADDPLLTMQSMADFIEFSSAIKELAVELSRMAGDLRLLSSGPNAGFAEITLPQISTNPSFIMPGVIENRIEPSVPESLNMVAYQIIGHDQAITIAAQAGQLEANAMMPLILHNILYSLDMLGKVILSFNQKCVSGIVADNAVAQDYLEKSGAFAFVLSKTIGADEAAKLITEAKQTGRLVGELAVEKGLLDKETLAKAFHYKALLNP